MWDDVIEGVPSTSSGPYQDKTQDRLLQGTNERMCYLSFIEKEVNEIKLAHNLSQCDEVDSEMAESDSDNPSTSSQEMCKGVRIDRQQKYSRKPVAGWNTYVCLDDYLNKLAWYSKPNETNDQWNLFEKSKQTQQHESEPTLSLHEYYGSNYEYYDEWGERYESSSTQDDPYKLVKVKLYDVKRSKKNSSNVVDNLNVQNGTSKWTGGLEVNDYYVSDPHQWDDGTNEGEAGHYWYDPPSDQQWSNNQDYSHSNYSQSGDYYDGTWSGHNHHPQQNHWTPYPNWSSWGSMEETTYSYGMNGSKSKGSAYEGSNQSSYGPGDWDRSHATDYCSDYPYSVVSDGPSNNRWLNDGYRSYQDQSSKVNPHSPPDSGLSQVKKRKCESQTTDRVVEFSDGESIDNDDVVAHSEWGDENNATQVKMVDKDSTITSKISCFTVVPDNSDPVHEGENPMRLEELDGTLYELRPEQVKGFVQAVIDWEGEEKQGSSNPPQMASAYAAYEEKRKVTRANGTVHEFSLDSASNIHVLSLEAASLLFESRESNLKVLGVSGVPTTANTEGQLILNVMDGDKEYMVDLGTSYGIAGCPLNILSISKLIKQRAIVHFEEGNCYIKIDSVNHPNPIPIVQQDGMFKIKCKAVEDFEINPLGSSRSKVRQIVHYCRKIFCRIS